jgi:neopullulanase
MNPQLLARLRWLLLFFSTLSTTLSGQVDRMEPAHWWVGMKEPTVQILLHGQGISKAQVEVMGSAALLERVERVSSTNYLFLYLKVHENASPGMVQIRLDHGDRQGTEVIEYALKARRYPNGDLPGLTPADVLYLLMPDRFANGDPGNDSVAGMRETKVDRNHPYGRHGGDLAGVLKHLDYFQQLGVTALWLNPVLENDMPDSSYHGYAITDFYKVDPRLGSMDLYLELAGQARAKGIQLVKDMVFNHCGLHHWWMADLPDPDWINQHQPYRETNHLRTTNFDPYASKIDAALMRDGWFVPSMPDLNLRHPLLADYLIQNSIWWVEMLGLGGIRMDTYPYPDKHAMARWCERVMQEYPKLLITGEEWSVNPHILAYWQKGKVNPDGYEGNLPSLLDFPLQNALKEALQEEESWGTGFIKLYEMLANDGIYADPSHFVTFLGNHDMPRYYMEVGSNEDAYRNAFAYLVTTRGIPHLYYGDEVLMTHYEGNGHGVIRKGFPGGWNGDTSNVFTGFNLIQRQQRTLDFTRRLLHWRKGQLAIHEGRLIHFGPANRTYVLFRVHENGNAVMTILNKNREFYNLALERFAEVMEGYSSAYDVIRDEHVNLGSHLMLAPNQPYVLELHK